MSLGDSYTWAEARVFPGSNDNPFLVANLSPLQRGEQSGGRDCLIMVFATKHMAGRQYC